MRLSNRQAAAMATAIALLCAAAATQLVTVDAVEETVVLSARADISALIQSDVALGPKFVRLSFHDCVGGCDGCVRLDNPDNAGLETPINALAGVVNKYSSAGLSRADVWALAGLTAARDLQSSQSTGNRPFELELTGRPTCSSSNPFAGPDHEFPNANGNTDHFLSFFANAFGMTDPKDVVALLGAHTIGRASPENSGFDGPWVPDFNTLSNSYYGELLAPPWFQDTVPATGAVQWVRSGLAPSGFGRKMLQTATGTIMLNVDVALIHDFDSPGDYIPSSGAPPPFFDGQLSCTFGTFGTCDTATQTVSHVNFYAQPLSEGQWKADFERVFKVIIDRVPDNFGGSLVPVGFQPPPAASSGPPPPSNDDDDDDDEDNNKFGGTRGGSFSGPNYNNNYQGTNSGGYNQSSPPSSPSAATCTYNGVVTSAGKWYTGPTQTCYCNDGGDWDKCHYNSDSSNRGSSNFDYSSDSASCTYNNVKTVSGQWYKGPSLTCYCDNAKWVDCYSN